MSYGNQSLKDSERTLTTHNIPLLRYAPSDLIKNYRMEKAARLLREEDLSIQDVIADVGISSRSYFYK